MNLIADDAVIHTAEGGMPGRLTLGKLLIRLFTWEDDNPEMESAPYVTARVAHFVHGVKADGHDVPDEELRDLIAQRQEWDVEFARKRRELGPTASEDWAHGEGDFDDSSRAPLWFAFDAHITWVRHSDLTDIPGSAVNVANQVQTTGASFLTVEEAMEASEEALASLDGIESFIPEPVAEALVIPPAAGSEEAAVEGGEEVESDDEFVADGPTVGDDSINEDFEFSETEEEVFEGREVEIPVESDGLEELEDEHAVNEQGDLGSDEILNGPELTQEAVYEPWITIYHVPLEDYLEPADQERPRS